ncbi:hypothetical protein N7510_011810 [Penicillium lagena]|uniref:uncharacterized protein n=1 Tax=Penicillium lagena TaxID=94218 RepID=UPI002541364A|nr:uncharacterized protein N7510_011810 [Penicillium lagena]KAJ5602276.1 hypothetical protein N7510_011810 [Penicillium lagena]
MNRPSGQAVIGSDGQRRSDALASLLHKKRGGTDLFVASTYKDILAFISQRALKHKVIRLGAKVTHVISKNSKETAAGSRTTIKTDDGEEAAFDEVVVTCPLGWLKVNAQKVFTPALHPRLLQAINNIKYVTDVSPTEESHNLTPLHSYGCLDKIYLTFPEAFWLKGGCPVFTHFHNPDYVSHASDAPCNAVIISLAHLPRGTAHPTLMFYIYGPCSAQLLKYLEHLGLQSDAYNKCVDAFAQPHYSRMPNYYKENASCRPVSCMCTAWQRDPLAGNGSYTHFRKGVTNAAEDVEVMRNSAGLGESKGIWIAGEHTAPTGLIATTTGAYISGQRIARKICDKWSIGGTVNTVLKTSRI